ncbi:MAG: low molecular weight protein arginine phosphatase [Bacillota bacterium]|nr:low molecular weight protein arginine phosphatase [Bacillota bacterium]
MLKILFVCTGNTCRSPIAAFLFKNELKLDPLPYSVEVFSAGLAALEGAKVAEPVKDLLSDRGIGDIAGHRAVRLSKNMVEESDLIFVMTADQLCHLRSLFPEAEGKTYLLTDYASNGESIRDIKDPYGKEFENYQESLEDIHNWIKKIMLKLKGGYQHEAGSGQ